MEETISVIIPAYNVEGYIDKCIQSVLSQTYSDLEVIVIDDGSTDDTAELISAFSSDKRIKIIKQKNAGVTSARNNGIYVATGKYLTFVDSDDWLETDMYEKMFNAIVESNADIAVCDYNLIYNDRIDKKYSNLIDETINIKPSKYFLKYCCCPKPNNYIWTRLYKTDIVKNSCVRFENYKLGDDTLFNFKLLPYIKRAVNISSSLYNYLQRKNSNIYTVAKHNNLAVVYADTFDSLINHYKSNGFEDYLEAMPIHAYTRLRSIVFYSRIAGMKERDIADSISIGFRNREIAKYLRDTSIVDDYGMLNSLTCEEIDRIKQIMQDAADKPENIIGVEMV